MPNTQQPTTPLDALNAEDRTTAERTLDLALNGELSMSQAIAWARRAHGDKLAEYFQTF